ncbi:MAG TPA: LacI family transcriptional regulator [Firmicutes bacterium]|nr:LacI family transcriptional regulator [Bacillota bacterium]
MSTTIRDVARLAGVSVSTVSLVLNDKPNVAPETRSRVLDAIRKLNYHPSSIAQRFATSRTNTIGLYAFISGDKPYGGFYMPVIQGMIEASREYGYSFQIDIKGEDRGGSSSSRAEVLAEVARQRKVDGLLILSHWPLRWEDVGELVQRKFPFVIVGQDMSIFDVNSVLVDQVKGAFEATSHLIRRGHTRIAHITGPAGQHEAEARLEGYRRALEGAGLPVDEGLIFRGDFHKASARECMRRILDLPDPPTAVFVANDNMCLGAMQVIRDRGLSIPGDIAIVGFDDIEAAAYTSPALTTVRQPLFDLGEQAADVLYKAILGDSNSVARIVLEPELVVRESS